MWTVSIRDQAARFVQSDLDLHCPQELHVSSPVRKELTHYHTMKTIEALEEKAYENILGKEENAGNQDFLLFPQCFLSYETQF